jgi:hypothetical protein
MKQGVYSRNSEFLQAKPSELRITWIGETAIT